MHMGFHVELTFKKAIKCWLCQGRKITNISYQIPSIPKVKAVITSLTYNIDQGKDKRKSQKNFFVLFVFLLF